MERSCLGSEGEHSSGFLWPQRNYTCSFCKRQFNSAQALGGHMNVHRRDRAMLIQLPSWVFDQAPNPNTKSHPNPNFPPSTSTLLPYHFLSSPSTSLSSSSYKDNIKFTSTPLYEDSSKKSVVEVEEFDKGFAENYNEVLNKNEFISLDLEIGCKDPKEVLDLELRLGCF